MQTPTTAQIVSEFFRYAMEEESKAAYWLETALGLEKQGLPKMAEDALKTAVGCEQSSNVDLMAAAAEELGNPYEIPGGICPCCSKHAVAIRFHRGVGQGMFCLACRSDL